MTCNCDNDGSNEYIIELGEFGLPGAKGDRGEQGYSPVVSYTTNSDTIQFTLVNENSTLTTPNYYDYLAKRDLSNSSIYTILSDYPTNSQVASTYLTITGASNTYFTKTDALNKLNTNGSNALNPITINNLPIEKSGTGAKLGNTSIDRLNLQAKTINLVKVDNNGDQQSLIQMGSTGNISVRAGGTLTLGGSGTRPGYSQSGGSAKSLALLSDVPTKTSQLTNDNGFLTATDITNKMNTDGSNATQGATINQAKFTSLSNNGGVRITNKNGRGALQLSSNLAYLQTGSYGLIADYTSQLVSVGNVNGTAKVIQATSDKVYYETYASTPTDATKEIATLGDINDATITITQGGVTKGTFTLNQSGNATIALDAGGSASTNPIVLKTTDESRSLALGLDNDTKKAYMTYTISSGGMDLPLSVRLIAGKSAPITLTETNEGLTTIGLDYNTDTLGLDANNKLTVVGAETNFDIIKEDNGTTYTYTNGFNNSNKYYEQIVQDDGNTTTTTNIISKYNFNGSNGIDVSVSSSTSDGNFANIRTYNISNSIDNSTIKVNGSGQLYADLEGKQNKLTSQNAGDGINIYEYYPDAVAIDYYAQNSSQQYVSYSVADESAWVSTRPESPRGIAITDTLNNISSKAFEYIALVPYSAGAGISLKLNWDYDASIIQSTDGIALSASGGEEPSSSGFIISGAYFKKTNTISITNEQYTQIQEQGGVWFKITSDGNGNYNSYYSLDNDTWVEIIFSDNSKFSPEHTPERPCIGCGDLYNPTATFNLQTASFTFTPARNPYTKIEVDSTAYYTKAQVDALLQTLTARITALETNINGGNA